MSENGGWNMERIDGRLNEEGKELLLAVLPPTTQNGEDTIRWGTRVQNKYMVSDMYHILQDEHDRKESEWQLL